MAIRSTTVVDTGAYTTDEVTVISRDGTKAPLSILHERDLALDGSHPTELVGYGAYGASLEAGFYRFFALARTGRHLRFCSYSRWRRVWRAMASCR